MEELGQVTLEEEGKKGIHLLSIIGEVEGHENASGNSKTTKYDHVLPKLAQIEDDDRIGGLLVLLNTSGGDVDAGLAIAEMIASLSIPSVSLVLGGSHSIGLFLYRTDRNDDGASGADERDGDWDVENLRLF